jgi:protoporphyrinogen oxidase
VFEEPVIILGGGLAGLSAAYHLRQQGIQSTLYEKEARVGGHARTHVHEGFAFDEGPHVSFTKDAYVQQLFAKSAGDHQEFLALQENFYQGQWLGHPALCHLFGLPAETIARCLIDAFEACQRPGPAPRDYEAWLRQSCGAFFAEEFAARYTRKYWTVEPRELTTDWIGSRVYAPKIEEVVRGALSAQRQALHYIQHCRYPTEGGFEGYTHVFQEGLDRQVGCELVELDVGRRQAIFSNGRTVRYQHLVCSAPLPRLVDLIVEAPAPVRRAADNLRWTSVYLVNIGVAREDLSRAHWRYIYDEDILFSRVSFPHLFSPQNAPPGCGSIQAEVYYSRSKPLSTEGVAEKSIEDLRRINLLHRDDELLYVGTQDVEFANVLFDHERATSVQCIHEFLRTHFVYPCGRYGEWGYLWSDQSVLSGQRAAQDVARGLEQTTAGSTLRT